MRFGILGAFALGVGIGTTVEKWLPQLKEVAGPVTENLTKKGLQAVEKTKEVFWAQSEKVADLLAEVKEEKEEKVEKASPKVAEPKTKPRASRSKKTTAPYNA